MKLLIYTPHITSRIEYTTALLFGTIGGLMVQCTQDKSAFINTPNCFKINYSAESVCSQELWIQPHGLLEQAQIVQQQMLVTQWNGMPAFFGTNGHLPFDLLAASFYLVSRYEEYLPHQQDVYGRYAHTNSLAYQHNFLQAPLVNQWVAATIAILQQQQPLIRISKPDFTFLPTYDIDIAYCYLHKPVIQNIGGFIKDLFTGRINKVLERAGVLLMGMKDPFINYDFMDAMHEICNLHPVYFFLLAQKRKAYDKNISPKNKHMQQLIRWQHKKYITGIHPSWQSNDSHAVLQQEILLLQSITEKPVTHSRQHYIKMNLPETYSQLLQAGIQHDYSMGYGSINGFRASIATPHYWFNLSANTATSLLIHPFCYMEANSFFEQHYTAETAAKELQYYHDITKATGGTLVTIFHNHFLTEQKEWQDWREMYRLFILNNFPRVKKYR